MALIKLCLAPRISKCSLSWICPVFSCVLEQVSNAALSEKAVHHYTNGCLDWLISGQQSVNPSRKAISILSGKYKRFTFVHPVTKTYVL